PGRNNTTTLSNSRKNSLMRDGILPAREQTVYAEILSAAEFKLGAIGGVRAFFHLAPSRRCSGMNGFQRRRYIPGFRVADCLVSTGRPIHMRPHLRPQRLEIPDFDPTCAPSAIEARWPWITLPR